MAKQTRIPMLCPRCGHSTNRAMRAGGVFGSRFLCSSCGANVIAVRFPFWSAVYALALNAVLLTSFVVAYLLFNSPRSVEYALGCAILIVLTAIFTLSDAYWRAVLRWKLDPKVDQSRGP